jgi:hypothetical protein
MQLKITDARGQAEFLTGVIDCIFALGVTLANAGVIEREEIAEAMEKTTAQHKGRRDCQHPARHYAAVALAKMFRAQTYSDEDLPC